MDRVLLLDARQAQRRHLYQALYRLLRDTSFELIQPVHVVCDRAWDGKSHFCHGLASLWTDQLASFTRFDAFTNWDALTQEKPYWVEHLPITPQVQALQAQQKMPNRWWYKIKTCKNIETLAEQLSALLKLPSAETDFLWIFDLGRPLTEPRSWRNRLMSSTHHHAWHEIRIYLDTKRRLHFFDANVGAFRTRGPLTQVSELTKFCTALFKLLHYAKYQAIYVKQAVSLAPSHLKRLKCF